GVYAVGMSVLMILNTFRDAGVSQYIIQEQRLTEQRYGAAVAVSMVISVLFAAGLWISAGWVATFYREPGLTRVFHVFAVGLLLIPFTAPASTKLQRQMEFGLLLKIGTASTVVSTVVSVTLAWFGGSFISLAWGSFAGGLVRLVLLAKIRW